LLFIATDAAPTPQRLLLLLLSSARVSSRDGPLPARRPPWARARHPSSLSRSLSRRSLLRVFKAYASTDSSLKFRRGEMSLLLIARTPPTQQPADAATRARNREATRAGRTTIIGRRGGGEAEGRGLVVCSVVALPVVRSWFVSRVVPSGRQRRSDGRATHTRVGQGAPHTRARARARHAHARGPGRATQTRAGQGAPHTRAWARARHTGSRRATRACALASSNTTICFDRGSAASFRSAGRSSLIGVRPCTSTRPTSRSRPLAASPAALVPSSPPPAPPSRSAGGS